MIISHLKSCNFISFSIHQSLPISRRLFCHFEFAVQSIRLRQLRIGARPKGRGLAHRAEGNAASVYGLKAPAERSETLTLSLPKGKNRFPVGKE